MSDQEYPGDKRGRVRIPTALAQQWVALSDAVSEWADEECPATGDCVHAEGDCPWDWLDLIDGHRRTPGPLAVDAFLVKAPWTDDEGNVRWGLQAINGALRDVAPYRPDYYWTAVHPRSSDELKAIDDADMLQARWERSE